MVKARKKSRNTDLYNIEEFIIGWDMGNFNVEDNGQILNWLEDEFPFQGLVYRGGNNSNPKPPVSWTKTEESLIYYWHHVGIPNGEIPAWYSSIVGIDIPQVAKWYMRNADTNKHKFRAKRLYEFNEVISLYTPQQILRFGTIVEKGFGRNREVELIQS